MEYFTQFRKDLHGNESHVGSVDDILNNLFLLHSHLEDEEVDRVPTEIATVVAVPGKKKGHSSSVIFRERAIMKVCSLYVFIK